MTLVDVSMPEETLPIFVCVIKPVDEIWTHKSFLQPLHTVESKWTFYARKVILSCNITWDAGAADLL